ncbi:MAG: electron transport complex subunit RsxB [Gammaproteobacteria bacterium]|nr:electron transport complex subunit RsxB [Gammaproteobacteria bacterium]
MLSTIIVITLLAILFGTILTVAATRLPVAGGPRVDRIDALLPQTQCGQCGHAGCRPYAEAMASDQADINLCPPGGDATIADLANLLGMEIKPLDASLEQAGVRTVAVIDEQACIGCTLCIKACPVDAILGASKQMHTVIGEECTGCDLCIPPCPVDCIDRVPASQDARKVSLPPSNNTVLTIKTRNYITAHIETEDQRTHATQTCIRCGRCAKVCPSRLLPQQLYWHIRTGRFDKAQAHTLFDCIECGHCDEVCPSHIPLVDYYRHAKGEILKQEQDRQRAEQARQRTMFRNFRLDRAEQERAKRHAAKRAALHQ